MQNAYAAAAAWAAEAPTWVWTLAVLSVAWCYLGLQCRRKAVARSAVDARAVPPPHGALAVGKATLSLDVTGGRPTVGGIVTTNAAGAAAAAAVAAAEPFEPEPHSDPAAKARMKRLVAGLDAAWAASGPPLLDGGGMRVWHRPEGGSVHSFKYEVVMPVGPGMGICAQRG
jgi:hypothetical protein